MRGFEDQPIDWAPASVWHDDDGNRQQSVEFIAPGFPKPKGNVIKGRWGGYHDATMGLGDWLNAVSDQAQAAMIGGYRKRELWKDPAAKRDSILMFTGPIMVDITFVLERPKTFTLPVRLKDDKALWRSMFVDGMPPHIKKPDTDKLIRAVCDAMTSIVWGDDSQVVEVHARKRYAYPEESTGAIVLVTSNVRVT